ncbi:hypothetical protein K227x_60540 [Rubripirellula lacrimiformis]|uniref:Uncharacterized protein n=2 Tax=Rubripirellula lacrimiformis TaxID=1930273 RepID=A0A517NKI0_9BACT|nr:hypothetical protein K227x_60540 [Rubripirellula lacrimiformis]
MVQIESPPAQLQAGSSSVDSGAITEDAIAPNGQPGDGPPLDPSELPAEGFSGSEGFANQAAGAAAPMDWQSDRTRRTRQIALVTTISVATLLVAAVAFGWFVMTYGSGPDVVVEGTPADASSPGEDAGDPIPDSGNSNTVPPDAMEPGPANGELPADSVAGSTIDAAPAAAADPDAAAAGQEPAGQDPGTQPSVAMSEPSNPTGAADSEPGGSSVAPLDSLIPDFAAVQGPEDDATKSSEDADVASLMDLPPGLAQYTPFLLQEGPTEKPTLKAPPTLEQAPLDDAAEDDLDPLAKVQPRKLNLKSDLALKLAFRSDQYPLTDMVLMISQITGVPIQIDWVSFDLVGRDVGQSIKPPKTAVSARQVLDQIAAQVDAEIREEETLLVLTIADEPFAARYEQIVNTDDMGNDAESAAGVLADFLKGSIPSAANTDAAVELGGDAIDAAADGEADDETAEVANAGGPVGAIVNQRQNQQLAALAAETLRRMRGIDPLVPDASMNRWIQVGPGQTTDWPKIQSGEAGEPVDTPIALAGFLKRTARRNDASCLVNWYDANRRRATPERLLLPDNHGGLAPMLIRSLEPMGLYVRQVDANHWWVGSDVTYDRLPLVVASPPLGKHREVFVDQISRIMSDAGGEDFRLVIDPISDRALMMLPRFVARQLPKVTQRLVAN